MTHRPPGLAEAALQTALDEFPQSAGALDMLAQLVEQGLDRLPLPGAGATLNRWRALAAVAERDLSLAKLYEGHTDALAIVAEIEPAHANLPGTWGVWAAEPPAARVTLVSAGELVYLHGSKHWCSGAAGLSHGLLTAWHADGRGPQLVQVAMSQPGVEVDAQAWHAVGMAGSSSVDIRFDAAVARTVGGAGEYLSRPGFWQGGAGIAACWYGGARAIGTALKRSLARGAPAQRNGFALAAMGRIELSLHATAAILREGAEWIDAHPRDDARGVALRCRLAAEETAHCVLDEAGRALGAAAFCRDAHFARAAADLPVYIRQSHGERDFAALGELTLAQEARWTL